MDQDEGGIEGWMDGYYYYELFGLVRSWTERDTTKRVNDSGESALNACFVRTYMNAM